MPLTPPAPSRPLRDYAAIGDGRTVALIGLDGGVDWLPLPNVHSRPVFARLVDESAGGCIQLAPVEEYEVTRRYIPRTNVLETTFTTASGVATLTDAMVTGIAGRLPWAELARRVDGVKGEVEFAWCVQPGTMLRSAAPWTERIDGFSIMRIGHVSLAVTGHEHGVHGEPDAGNESIDGGFTATKGSRHLLVIAATEGEPLRIPDAQNVDRGIDRTIGGWEMWSDEFSYEGPWADDVQRSALALKLLLFSPTGAIAAAATTSLPENPRGGKNWDYRYAWVRDLAYTAHAWVGFGLREETHAAISWLLRTIRKNGPEVQVMYTLDGDAEIVLEKHQVPGWNGNQPVVTGNPAQGQLQLGVYGDLIALCRTYVEAGNRLDIQTGRLLADVADRTCDLWRREDSGMWELPELRHYTSSKMGCWKALDDAQWLAAGGHIPDNGDRWRAERDRIHRWVDERCWSEDLQAYTLAPGSEDLDASVLLHAPTGFDRGERMSRTVDAITERLTTENHLVYRYTGMDQEEHTFVACAFWRATALACVGRHAEAIEAMDALVAQGNDVGIYSEMIAEDDGAFWGNLPQALSHLALINAALVIREVVDDAELGDR